MKEFVYSVDVPGRFGAQIWQILADNIGSLWTTFRWLENYCVYSNWYLWDLNAKDGHYHHLCSENYQSLHICVFTVLECPSCQAQGGREESYLSENVLPWTECKDQLLHLWVSKWKSIFAILIINPMTITVWKSNSNSSIQKESAWYKLLSPHERSRFCIPIRSNCQEGDFKKSLKFGISYAFFGSDSPLVLKYVKFPKTDQKSAWKTNKNFLSNFVDLCNFL